MIGDILGLSRVLEGLSPTAFKMDFESEIPSSIRCLLGKIDIKSYHNKSCSQPYRASVSCP